MSAKERGVIAFIEGGRNFIGRISDMGLHAGAKIEMIKNDFTGPVIVKSFDSKIILGRFQSQKIFINLKSNEKNA